MTKYEEIIERLIRLEEKFDNHLKHHWRILIPMLIGVIVLIIGLYIAR